MSTELVFKNQSKFGAVMSDIFLMIKRSSTHIIRNTDQLLGAFFQPIMFLLLFASVFGGSIEKALPPGVSYINFLMAGIIVQTVAFGSTTTAIAVATDMKRGIIDRFRSLPMSDIAVLAGHVVSDIFRNAISTTVMLISGLVIGFRPHASPLEWLAIVGLLLLFTFAFSWLAAIIGVLAKSAEAVQWLTFVLVFPLTFASSAFTPAEGMPKYLRIFAQNQPITQVVEAVRALILGNPVGDHAWKTVAWCLVTLVVAIPLASRLFRNKNT
jgi:ABC-2 type transport system permease protein